MSTLINKCIDLLTKKVRKFPKILIIFLIFAVLFPQKAINLKNILFDKINDLCPDLLTQLYTKLYISHENLLTIWGFLLIIFAITLLLDILHQWINDRTYIIINRSSTILFEINTVILLLVLIYKILYAPAMEFPSASPNDIYGFFISYSIFLFVLTFAITYGSDFILLFQKIHDSGLSVKKKFILYVTYITACFLILSTIYNKLFH
ncbi:hypothetical protein [Robinsoniella sp. KNHs210]|uniref:hypothetical protein n=1 Tax=Robinsoniella sp. KNHs210 TaxID=1469950 RepID=UPI000482E520|nr:hypothetical protein [Robinsoniella sp. KNHs210]